MLKIMKQPLTDQPLSFFVNTRFQFNLHDLSRTFYVCTLPKVEHNKHPVWIILKNKGVSTNSEDSELLQLLGWDWWLFLGVSNATKCKGRLSGAAKLFAGRIYLFQKLEAKGRNVFNELVDVFKTTFHLRNFQYTTKNKNTKSHKTKSRKIRFEAKLN